MEDKNLEARVCGRFDEEMFEAIEILRDNEFRISTTPVSGQPVKLGVRSYTYQGLKEIQKFVKNYKETGEIIPPRRKYIL